MLPGISRTTTPGISPLQEIRNIQSILIFIKLLNFHVNQVDIGIRKYGNERESTLL